MNWLNKLLEKLFKVRDEKSGDVIKPFLDHMEDLRWTIIKILTTLVITMFGSFFFRQELFQVMLEPLKIIGSQPKDPVLVATSWGVAILIEPINDLKSLLIFMGPVDSIMASLTLSFYAGIAISFPFLLYFILDFVLPAMTRKEKQYMMPAIGAGFLFFLTGVLVSYYYVLPTTLKWLHDDAMMLGVDTKWMVREYFSFVTKLTLAFGILSEVPVVMITLAFLGLISFKMLNATRPYAYIGILILAAFIAPTPDPVTFLSLAAPVIVLYETCIWVVLLIERFKARKAARLE